MIDTPLLFLDMDSTVRHGYDELGKFVNGPEDVEVFYEAKIMMNTWRQMGGRIVTVSNQKGIGLGIVTPELITDAMWETYRQCDGNIDFMTWCPHSDSCWCRKPEIGLLVQGVFELERKFPEESFPLSMMKMVGDRPEDMACARKADINFQWAHHWRELAEDQ